CVWDNYHSGYSSSEAFGRSAIDVIGSGTLIGLSLFTPIGLGGLLVATVVVTVGGEVLKKKIYNY
ncbi:hypothetical protein, partial [Clostridium guangxiense]|uniref:hypothetical protein n=1 Tax=Clostridium guangxiense TaxID=1662055 RepID=UPI001E5B06C5